jgi:hypothetical protein
MDDKAIEEAQENAYQTARDAIEEAQERAYQMAHDAIVAATEGDEAGASALLKVFGWYLETIISTGRQFQTGTC